MTYKITLYSKNKAKKLNVDIRPSRVSTKKIDVFSKKGKLLASIGANGMKDYPTWIKSHGKEYANERRRLYKLRHKKDRIKRGTPGWFADKLLW